MNSARNSIQVFGIYLIIIPGLGLIFIPNLIFDLFGLRYGEELWLPRMIGFLALALGVYYTFIAKYKLESLYKITVIVRLVAAAFMVSLWAMKEVEVGILLFAVVDALGALWTMYGLKNIPS